MRAFRLIRACTGPDGTFGVLVEGGEPVCVTLEEQWLDNMRSVSCIPEGVYTARRTVTPKHGNTWEIRGVKNRTAILIHTGNTEADTEGCVVVGKEFGYINARDEESGAVERQPAVLRSREAFQALTDRLHDAKEFILEVEWSPGALV